MKSLNKTNAKLKANARANERIKPKDKDIKHNDGSGSRKDSHRSERQGMEADEGEVKSGQMKKVRFGKPQSKGYLDSVRSLRASLGGKGDNISGMTGDAADDDGSDNSASANRKGVLKSPSGAQSKGKTGRAKAVEYF
jgi:hypothetical protein